MGLQERFIHWVFLYIPTASFSVSINGDLEGFFSSTRGLRQGCSLSPYLYVILNNVISKLLNHAAEQRIFGYNPFFKEVKLTHLCFADDILVFSDGSPTSLHGILQTMDDFARMSELHISIKKSCVYASGTGSLVLNTAASQAGTSVGFLPIWYLGLPLTTKSMTQLDYKPLLDEICNCLLYWRNKSLSYAGRLQLIKPVITSILNFWCSLFMLLDRCLDAIESMCSAFLWSGSPNDAHKAKVIWEDVCYPKKEVKKACDSSRIFALSLI